ncbi:MAG: hypothetical protein Ct9H300mP11_00330 [Chloroflexota bacterium]|nr:MAG: hypothetical protein Ct9H300mP11_00330 [Chloroflexota bacterium]
MTAVTAQNTVAVTAVHEIPTTVIEAQIQAIISDIGVDALKTGMLSSRGDHIVCCRILEERQDPIPREKPGLQLLVVDPVMVSKSGDSLLKVEAVGALRQLLLPLGHRGHP